ncbi:hypothetical protein [Thalassotalea sp. ND16A]|uniref:hypothetical protein n=1 Tax=Thalassotalea sp. ND16A TaxID=1535422 RepID=UPI00051A5CB6|nr:hypothetical protein [Thalassotalea sp. ND16A]KGK00061.1 hypothetical protein ND16A_0252 [Thalassotalea sp. ND16A]
MWRSLTIALVFFILAQTANALSCADVNINSYSQSVQTSPIEQPSASLDDELEDLLNLPRLNRTSASIFSNELQTTANYVLEIEFFESKLSAGLFKNLANPAVMVNWFEQLSSKTHSSRISGWKDGNSLYTSGTTYHS